MYLLVTVGPKTELLHLSRNPVMHVRRGSGQRKCPIKCRKGENITLGAKEYEY